MLIGPALTGYFSTPSTMPGAVIEPLYLTDPSEGSIAASSTGQRVIAQGLANAIEDFLSTSSR
jgi:N-acetylmuramoyl-L-alanine amidase